MSQNKIEDHRRKWDKEEYERLALERLAEELESEGRKKSPPVRRELLRQRDFKVDLESKLGKTVVITKNTPSSQTGGYHCGVCDCVVKDSINYLDHINGKKHQRNLGMSMKVERSTVEQVRKRFEVNKKKMEEKKKEYNIDSRVIEIKEEEEKLKEYRRERKKDKKRKLLEDDDDDSQIHTFEDKSDLAAIMGFSGFGSKKRK